MNSEYFVATVVVAPSKCKNIKNAFINEDGKAEVMVIDKTTAEDAKKGNSYYGISGEEALVLDKEMYAKKKEEINSYLKKRFRKSWTLKLKPLKLK